MPTLAPIQENWRTYWTRIQDPARWRWALSELIGWLLFGLILTTAISYTTPGYPIIVGTPSIPVGLYWLDLTATIARGDLVTFPFTPTQPTLIGRYGRELVHTKHVLGMAGDTVYADHTQKLTLCPLSPYEGPPAVCVSAGQARHADSHGRELVSWIPAGGHYLLQPGEYWVYSAHPFSLDSRYHGPISSALVRGKATPLITFAGEEE